MINLIKEEAGSMAQINSLEARKIATYQIYQSLLDNLFEETVTVVGYTDNAFIRAEDGTDYKFISYALKLERPEDYCELLDQHNLLDNFVRSFIQLLKEQEKNTYVIVRKAPTLCILDFHNTAATISSRLAFINSEDEKKVIASLKLAKEAVEKEKKLDISRNV